MNIFIPNEPIYHLTSPARELAVVTQAHGEAAGRCDGRPAAQPAKAGERR